MSIFPNSNGHSTAASASVSDRRMIEALLAQLLEQQEAFKKLLFRFDAMEKQVESLCGKVESVVVVLAEENRQLREKETDRRVTVPYALALVSIIDRQNAEVTELEQRILPFVYIENCRAVDQQEHLNILSRMGIEEIRVPRGTEANSDLHEIERIRPTTDRHKYGRVSRVLKRGFRRRHDGMLIRPAVVEVWGPAIATS